MGLIAIEPQKFEEAIKEDKWVKAMDEEINMIKKNNNWELVDCPQGKEVISLKWIQDQEY